MRFYALAQRPWIEEADGFGYWGLPPGTIGSVDLAPVGSQAHVFATSDAPFDSLDVEVAIGDGTRLDSYIPTAVEATAWETLVGVAHEPGWTLLDLLWHTLTDQADPDGLARARPIMPTHRGVLELHLGGHSLIRAEKLPADPTTHPAWPNIQRVLQNDYRAIQARDRTLARKWLGAQAGKYRLSPERARDLLIPTGLPRELPLRPTTTITDDFNRADSASLGSSAEGWSWSNAQGSWEIASNAAKGSSTSHNNARADSDLSGDDHYAEVVATMADASSRDAGVIARFSDSANTGYVYLYGRPSASAPPKGSLYRLSSGSYTLLASADGFGAISADTMRLNVDGSSLTGEFNGAEHVTFTDSNITGNLRCGLRAFNTAATFDNFEAADLLAAGATVEVPLADSVAEALAPAVAAGAVVAVPLAESAAEALAPVVTAGAAVAIPLAETASEAPAPQVAAGAAVNVPLSQSLAEALAPQLAAGAAIRVPLAQSVAEVLAPGVVVGVAFAVTPPERIFVVPRETRRFVVAPESRRFMA